MRSNMTLTEEIQAIQGGSLPCSDHKLAVCVTYCKRRTKAMTDLMNSEGSKAAIAERLTGMQEKIDLYSKFIAWAEMQPGNAKAAVET